MSPDSSLQRSAATTALEPGIVGRTAHEVSHRERTMEPLSQLEGSGGKGSLVFRTNPSTIHDR